MDKPLEELIDRLILLVDTATGTLQAGLFTDPAEVAAWQQVMEELLTRYHAAALMTGLEALDLPPRAIEVLKRTLTTQFSFLDQFALAIQDDSEWQAGYNARARMYAEAIGQSYEAGTTKLLPLPALPRDGSSQCLTNCYCHWETVQLAGEGNYDCYWRLGTKENCQTCQVRAQRWNPLQIRGGSLVSR